MFDKDRFLKANQNNKENNPFTDIEDGFYTLELTNATMGKAKNSNRKQVVFEYEFDDNNDKYDDV